MAKKKKSPDFHAKLIVHDLDGMSPEDRNGMADWLIEKAAELRDAPGELYAKKTKFRYMK